MQTKKPGMAMRRVRILLLMVWGTWAFAAPSIARAESVQLAIGADAGPLEQYAASELQRYVERLFGVSARVMPTPEESADSMFFLATTDQLERMPNVGAVPALTDQGFLLRTMPWNNKPALAIVGGSPEALLWGVYELVEHYGVRYLLSGDVYPQSGRPFFVPEIDKVFEPVFRVRMWKTMGDFAMGMESWGMADYRPFIDQLAKLKFNRIRVSSGPSQPFLSLTIKGIKQQSATLWYGEHFPITDDMPGRSLFGNATEFWNPDLPLPAEGVDKLTAAGVQHCRELMAYAHSRGIGSNFVGSITDFPKDFASLLPEVQEVQQLGQMTVSPGPSVRPDNPVLNEVAGAVLKTIVDTYPEADSYGFPLGTEWPSWIDLYEWAWKELDAKYRISEITSLEEVLQSAGRRTAYTGGAERAVMQTKGDLAGLSFFDRLRTDPNILPKSSKPDAKFVYYEISEDLFPILPRILPRDAELLIVLDYTPTRVLRRSEVFERIPTKEIPTTLALTLQDDGVGVPPQLTTESVHKLVCKMREHGLSGFCTRQWMISDLDPSVAYLARAAWDSSVTPDSAYRDHVRSVYGEKAVEPLLEAFREIENVTVGLEDHGLGIGFPIPTMIMRHWSPDDFAKEFNEDRAGYRRALDAVRKVTAPATSEGKTAIAYWIGRLEFGIGFFDTIECIKKAAKAEQAAKDAQKNGDETLYKAKLAEAAELAKAAQDTAFRAIQAYANVSRNQSDRGAVATMAQYIYRPLKAKAEELRAGRTG